MKNDIVQSVLFDLKHWSFSDAMQWLDEHDYTHHKIDITTEKMRFRQHDPYDLLQEGYTVYRTKKLPNHVELIIAYIK